MSSGRGKTTQGSTPRSDADFSVTPQDQQSNSRPNFNRGHSAAAKPHFKLMRRPFMAKKQLQQIQMPRSCSPPQLQNSPKWFGRVLHQDHHPTLDKLKSASAVHLIAAIRLLIPFFGFIFLFTVTRPVRSQTPPTFVGIHVHSGVLSSQPWPSDPTGSIRLCDTRTSWNKLERP